MQKTGLVPKKVCFFKEIVPDLQKRLAVLSEIHGILVQKSKNLPEGSLKVVKKPGGVQFYWRKTEADRQGTYIRKKNLTLMQKLAQKSYVIKLEKVLERHIKKISDFSNEYFENELGVLYESLNQSVRSLVEPVVISKTEFVNEWLAVEYQGKGFDGVESGFYTARGEQVRSKSEVLIADALFRAGVPYRYEFPVRLKMADGFEKVFYPDFMCLNPNTGNEILWEHFGLMDDLEYSRNALEKIQLYAENGFVLGKNLIFTMESRAVPLNIKYVKKLIKENFCD